MYDNVIQKNEQTSIYPPDWNIREAERRTFLFSIYHCTSQLIPPEVKTQSLRCVFRFNSPAMINSSLLLLQEENEDYGIKKQEMTLAAYQLGSLSSVGGALKLWKFLIQETGVDTETGKKQYAIFDSIRKRIGGLLVSDFMEYITQNIVIMKDDSDLLKHTDDFFEAESGNIPSFSLKKCRNVVKNNSELWEQQGASVKEWLESLE
ncbi:MAG: hypothetical protein EZS28_024339 [Streblomastix strix]|uniref:ERAP1-like C-terminal domain-containing protein n=1 Tax=Streblomastix strix TaxID=222440 RepID=A0A5J4VCH5_9EUKA|nr:MAG: hypothetical protein EZS28_024339 [Streblomastix strix]